MEIELYTKTEVEDEQYGNSTIGELFIDGEKFCVTLEDQFNPLYNKVPGETRIPAGRFPIRKRKVLSGLTKRYRNRKSLKGVFDYHLEICDVPMFKYVYIHIGNKPADTDGCVLVASRWVEGRSFISRSTPVYIDFYKMVSEVLESGEEVWINVFRN